MKKGLISTGILGLCCASSTAKISAQLSLSAQVRTRTELRDGQGAPLPKGALPAFFTSQRSRLSAGFSTYRVKLGLSLQDVRVWGQDVSTINRTSTADNNALMVHEAWAEMALLDTTIHHKYIGLKLGRQEWVYDDSRLLGNLDWLQQARRHDGALLKYEKATFMIHAAAAFNQNKEAASGTLYNNIPPGNYAATTNGGSMYKSLQFVYLGKKLSNGIASFLFLADQFNKYHLQADSSLTTKVWDRGSVSRFTTGWYIQNTWGKSAVTTSAYYQFGKNAALQPTRAFLLSAALSRTLGRKLTAAAGVDYTSGGTKGSTSKAFDPLYGTPHKFWGLMDYFYVASPFGKGGLVDYYVKTKYKASEKLTLTCDLHQFNSATAISLEDKNSNPKNFGQELDLVANYALTKQIGFEAGYAHFFATSLLTSPQVKNINTARNNANWAYVTVNVKPEFLFHTQQRAN